MKETEGVMESTNSDMEGEVMNESTSCDMGEAVIESISSDMGRIHSILFTFACLHYGHWTIHFFSM